MKIKTDFEYKPEECHHDEGDAIATSTYCKKCGESFDMGPSPLGWFLIGAVTSVGSLLLGIWLKAVL